MHTPHRQSSPTSPHKLIDITKLKSAKSLSQVESVFQLAILLLSRHLALEPRQVLALLADDCKYFGHLAIKGKKNSFTELIALFTELQSQLGRIATLIKEGDPQQIEFLLHLIRPCLLSKSKELSMLALSILNQLAKSLNTDLYGVINQPNGILSGMCLSLKRHPDLLKTIYELLVRLASQQRYNALMLIDLRCQSNNEYEYLRTMLLLIEVIEPKKFIEHDCLAGLLNITESIFQRESIDMQMTVLQLIDQLHHKFSAQLQNSETYMPLILDIIKKGTRKQSFVVKQTSFAVSFSWLEKLAISKNPQSGVLFKRMIFCMIENHSNMELRHIIAVNLRRMINQFQTIPVDQLVQPLVKQLQLSEDVTYMLNVFDIELFQSVCVHPKLSPSSGITLFDYMVSLSLKNISMTVPLVKCIAQLVNRFSEEEQLRDRILTQVQVLLELQRMLMRPTKPANQMTNQIKAFKKQIVIRLLSVFIQLQIQQVNTRCKTLLAALYREVEQMRGLPDNDLYRLMTALGIPEFIAKEPSADPSQLARNRSMLETEDSRLDRVAIIRKHKEHKKVLQQSEIDIQKKISDDIERSKQRFVDLSARRKKMGEVKAPAYSLPQVRRNKSTSLPLVGNPESILSVSIASTSDRAQVPVYQQLIRPFNSVKESYVISKWQPMNLAEEEQRDQRTMDIYCRKYNRFIRMLFSHLSNIVKPIKDTGNELQLPPPMISFVDCIRMLREENSSRLSKPIINEIIIAINNRSSGVLKNPLSGIVQQGLQPFLQQFIYGLQTHDRKAQLQNYIPMGLKLQMLLRSIAKDEPILRFNEYDQDVQTNSLNKKLQDDPQIEIPSTCKKVDVESVEIQFIFSEVNKESSKLSTAYFDCYEILSEILQKSKMQIRLMEPLTAYHKVTRIVKKDRPFKKIDLTKHKSELIPHSRAETVNNDFMRRLKEKEQQMERIMTDKQAKRREHLKSIKESLETTRLRKKQQQERKQKQKQKEQTRKKKNDELWHSYHQQQKKLLIELKEKKNQKKQEEGQKKKEEQEKRKQKLMSFISKQNQKLHQRLESSKAKAQQNQELSAKKQVEELQKKLELQMKLKSVRESATERKAKIDEEYNAIKEFFQSKEMKKELRKYIKSVEKLFSYYHAKYSQYHIETAKKQWLTLKGFTHLLNDFDLCPKVLTQKEALHIFKGLIKQKEQSGEQSLSYQEMLQLLGRLAMHSAKALQRMNLMKKQQSNTGNNYDNEFEKEEVKGSLLNQDKVEVDKATLVPLLVKQLLEFMDINNKSAMLDKNYT